jgi:rsbT co-antagonist protein RsbR
MPGSSSPRNRFAEGFSTMKLSQRRIGYAILGILLVAAMVLLTVRIITGMPPGQLYWFFLLPISLGVLLAAHWRGWPYTGQALVVTLLVIGSFSPLNYLQDNVNFRILIPPIVAMIFAGPAWVLGSAAAALLIILLRTGVQSPYYEPVPLVTFAICVAGLMLVRLATDNAKDLAEANASAEQARAQAEAQARELQQRAAELELRNDQQQHLLDLVTTLETPAVELAEGVLLAPIVGHTDTRRAQALTARLLQEVAERRTRLVILDIAGVSTMDTSVAKALLNTAQALRLLGCEVTITGISAAVAMTLTHLGIGLEGVKTTRSPQEALTTYLDIDRRKGPSKLAGA